MKKRSLSLLTAISLLAAGVVFGQTTGRIEGRVLDGEGPLVGVTVTISSPAQQGERFAVTEEDGEFRFSGVAPGEYKLVARLEGYGVTEHEGLVVRLDRTVTVEVELAGVIEETITVTGDSSVLIDQTSTTGGAIFKSDLFEQMPISRDVMWIAAATPGVTWGFLGANPSIGGASAAENRYLIDGLDTTDPALGTIGTSLPTEFVREVEVKTGGYEAEYGGALGGFLNLVTKSGGNELRYDAFAYYSDENLQSDQPQTELYGKNLGEDDADVGIAVGGKLLEDRLWYFAAVDWSESAALITTRGDLIRTRDNDRETIFYVGKLTWQLSPHNQLVFSAFGDPTDRRDTFRNAYGWRGAVAGIETNNYGVTLNSTLSSNSFLELSAGLHDEEEEWVPFADVPVYSQLTFADGNPGVEYLKTRPCGPIWEDGPGTGAFDSTFHWTAAPGCLGGGNHSSNDRSRKEYRGSYTWYAETARVDHELKLGGVLRNLEYRDHFRYPGPASLAEGGGIDSNGVIYEPTGLEGQFWELYAGGAILWELNRDSFGKTDEAAVYLQDAIRVGNRLTLNLGVRADSFTSEGGGTDPATGERLNVSRLFPERKLDFSFSDMIAPRIGFAADTSGTGRSKLYGHFGRFYESVPLRFNLRAFGVESIKRYIFFYPEDGSLPTGANPGTWVHTFDSGWVGTEVIPGIKPMYTQEWLLGFEYSLTDNLGIGLKYTDRSVEDVVEDVSVDGETYYIGNPGGTVTVNPVTGETLDEPVVFPEATRDYSAWELTVDKRFSDNWQLHASYVKSENFGNYGGLHRRETGQLDPNLTSQFDLPSLLIGAEGPLPNDREYQFKAYGSYLTPFDLSLGFWAEWSDGTPISKLGAHAHPTYGRLERFVTPRGTFGRTPGLKWLNLHLEYPIRLGGGTELKLLLDVTNLTDEQEPVAVDEEWTRARLEKTEDPNECGGADPACPDVGNPNFNTPTSYQFPRALRFGVKISRAGRP